ncbi:hypothetical protein K32_43570 [Kaistia sp. 32K]|uniref:hypothetical protein n=1 Tax=Kaistia sp. 32K TaxID=2795690 RepID=UPI00191657C1|nr:hypothetical protein [Kaistia sp. 32K]BCP55740.1 hypothetical protein K32_43570 [Kaistia sp. 32K]
MLEAVCGREQIRVFPVRPEKLSPQRGETLSGGIDSDVLLNSRVLPLPLALDRRLGGVAVGLSTDTPVEKELVALRFLLADFKMSYRSCGSPAPAFVTLAAGEVDAWFGFGFRRWEVIAAIPMLERLGGVATID